MAENFDVNLNDEVENFVVEFGEIQRITVDDFDKLRNRPSYNSQLMTHETNIPKVPANVSELNNDSDYQTGEEVAQALEAKQDKLTAGNNVQISEQNVISATDTVYSAGNGINISPQNALSVDTTVVATQQELSNEVHNRENADNYLQGQIDAISASSDVVDIVGTYADLQNYDTQHLKDNDIIKVLQDETQGNATTYYRWSTSTQTFTLIGQEGPYYTKAGADAQFVPQTRTVNGKALSSNITLDASDVSALGPDSVSQTTGSSTSQIMSQKATTDALGTKLNASDYVVDTQLADSDNPVQNRVLNGLLGNMPSDFFSGSATTSPTASTSVQFGDILNLDDVQLLGNTTQETTTGKNLVDLVPATNTSPDKTQSASFDTVYDSALGRNVLHASGTGNYPYIGFTLPNRLTSGKYYAFMIKYRTLTTTTGDVSSDSKNFRLYPGRDNLYTNDNPVGTGKIKDESGVNNYRLYDTQTYLTRCIRFYADPDVYDKTSAPEWYTGFSLSWNPSGITGNVSSKEIWIADIQIYEISQTDWDSNNYTGTDFEKYTGGIPAPNPDYPRTVNVVAGVQTITVSDGGSNTQTFTIDLGSTELCKIGDYQDYIYKGGSDWYLHKECASKTFDGIGESWDQHSVTNLRIVYRINLVDVLPYTNHSAAPLFISNRFRAVSNTTSWRPGMVSGENSHPAWAYFCVSPSITTVNDFETWLSTNNTNLYYVLATPTDTKITDATLISELEALLSASTYDGETDFVITATGTNLPAPLQLTAINANAKGLIERMRA